MSRIAKKPIVIPTGVDIKIAGQDVAVKGPKGELSHRLHPNVAMNQEADDTEGSSAQVLKFKPRDGSATANALAGTSRAIVNNMVVGVHTGFEKGLELIGVGYRAQVQGKTIKLSLGFSHPVEYKLPEGITAEAPSNTQLIIKGVDKQQVGQVAAEIRAFRPPEPYKGKGVRYVGEKVVRKETKKK